jgi:hypothetical protein
MAAPTGNDERRSFFARHVQLWKRSGLSMAAYCRREEIAYGAFVQWCRRLDGAAAGDEKPVSFVEVVTHQTRSSEPGAVVADFDRDSHGLR